MHTVRLPLLQGSAPLLVRHLFTGGCFPSTACFLPEPSSSRDRFSLFHSAGREHLLRDSWIVHPISCPAFRFKSGGPGSPIISRGSTGYPRYAAEQSNSNFASSVFDIPTDPRSRSSLINISASLGVRFSGIIELSKNTMPWLMQPPPTQRGSAWTVRSDDAESHPIPFAIGG